MIVEVAGVSVRWIKSVMKEVAGSNAVVSTVVSTTVETTGVVVAPSKTSVAAEAGGVVTDRTVVVKETARERLGRSADGLRVQGSG